MKAAIRALACVLASLALSCFAGLLGGAVLFDRSMSGWAIAGLFVGGLSAFLVSIDALTGGKS